jgi:hypothetical protein
MEGKPEFTLGYRKPNFNNASPSSYEMGVFQKPISDSRYINNFSTKDKPKDTAETQLADAITRYKMRCYKEGKQRITKCPTRGNKSFLNSPKPY